MLDTRTNLKTRHRVQRRKLDRTLRRRYRFPLLESLEPRLLLASLDATPDANSLDPFVVAKAAELNHDPAEIFQFMREQVAFESYTGSLRGARGTLWSGAGNSLD